MLLIAVVLLLRYLKNCTFFFLFNYYFTFTDINECDAKELNNCTSHQHCVNKLGSYHCSCIEGYHSDGEACVLDQFTPNKSSLAIILTIGKYIYCRGMIITYLSLHTHRVHTAMWIKIMFDFS